MRVDGALRPGRRARRVQDRGVLVVRRERPRVLGRQRPRASRRSARRGRRGSRPAAPVADDDHESHVAEVGQRLESLDEVVPDDDRLDVAVLDHGVEQRAARVGVERHRHPAADERAVERDQELGLVAQQEADVRAGPQTGRGRTRARPGRPRATRPPNVRRSRLSKTSQSLSGRSAARSARTRSIVRSSGGYRVEYGPRSRPCPRRSPASRFGGVAAALTRDRPPDTVARRWRSASRPRSPSPTASAGSPPEAIDALRDARLELEGLSGLDERTIELTRIGALVALGAPGRVDRRPRHPRASPAASPRRRSGAPCSRSRRSSACRA